jgi:dolichol-phosphate mannosyltransferase
MKNSAKISVLLPSYQEEENLRIILPGIISVLKNITQNYEIIVIDTMTNMDKTPEVCEKLGVKYINREKGNYYGDAIRSGITKAEGEYIVIMDADGSHTPEFIRNLYEHHTDNDVVIASRYVVGGNTDVSWILILMSHIVNILYSVILGLNCKDASNSFKLYRADLLKKITLRCNNFDIVEEILFKLKSDNKSIRIKEIPYVFKERMFGQTKRNLFLFILSYGFTIIRLRFSRK